MRRTQTFILVSLTVVVLGLVGEMTTVGQDETFIERGPASGITVPAAAEPSDVVAGLAVEVARLRGRLDRNAVQQEITRNPFLLVQTENLVSSDQTTSPAIAVASEPRVPASSDSPLNFSFIGIALDNGHRTAVFLLADGTVVLAGEGQRIVNSYRVDAIEESSAHVSGPSGMSRRYELR